MITDFYPLTYDTDENAFYFTSEGGNGIFKMAVFFEPKGDERFNLALCAEVNREWRDNFNTNNDDFLMIFSTVAAALYLFLEIHPRAVIEIGASDDRRLRVYNGIIKRRWHEIQPNFHVIGVVGEKKEKYNPGRFYQGFEIFLKR